MTTVSPKYGSPNAITITASSLATGTAHACAVINNGSSLFLDASVTVVLSVGSGNGTTPGVNIWFAGQFDGTDFTDNYPGTDSPVALRALNNLRGPFFLATSTSATFNAVIPSVNQVFGGTMLPIAWGLVVDNESGAALSSLTATYTGLNLTNA